jgi:hypothetical protein
MLYRHSFSTLLENIPLRGLGVNQEGFQLKGTHQFLVYSDYVNILGGGERTLKKNTYLI